LYELGILTACLTAWCRRLRKEAGLTSEKRTPPVPAVAPPPAAAVAARHPPPRWQAGR
jgi:hypothetical protein